MQSLRVCASVKLSMIVISVYLQDNAMYQVKNEKLFIYLMFLFLDFSGRK